MTGYRKGGDVEGSLHRCRGPGRGGDAAGEQGGARSAVRGGRREAAGLNPRDSVMTNAASVWRRSVAAERTARAPLAKLNAERAKVDLVVFVSDNQSWMDARAGGPRRD